MKQIKQMTAAMLLASLSSGVAYAELINADWQTEGDGKAFIDTISKMEWLDLSVTANKSVDEVMALTGAGELYEGWRLANSNEVAALIKRYVPEVPDSFDARRDHVILPHETNPQLYPVVTIMGKTAQNSRYDERYTGGYYQDATVETATHYLSGLITSRYYPSSTRDPILDFRSLHYGDGTNKQTNKGVFLISGGGATFSSQQDPSLTASPSAVSAPLGGALVGLALVGLGALRRRA